MLIMGEMKMSAYIEPTKDIIDVIKPYIKKGETAKISGILELNGKSYREVVFLKSVFLRNEKQGYIYLDDNINIVSSKNIQNELVPLAHYYELFLSEEKSSGFLAALSSMDGMERTNGDFQDVIKGLDFLKEQGVEAADKIKSVIIELPKYRELSNSKAAELIALIGSIKEDPFNEKTIKTLYPVYEQILKLNFEKVTLIATIEGYLDFVKEAAEKKRRKLAFRFNKAIVGPLMKVNYELSYFIRIIKTYNSILNMTTSQYLKFLSNMNKDKINNRSESIRS